MVEVRIAATDDAPRLTELHRELLESVEAIRGGVQWQATEGAAIPPWDGKGGAGSGQRVLVATIVDEVVGYAQYRVDGSRGVIEVLYVTPPARSVGAGDTLLRAAQAALVAEGCDRVDSYALPGDRDTKNFFESHAMVARLLVVSSPLSST